MEKRDEIILAIAFIKTYPTLRGYMEYYEMKNLNMIVGLSIKDEKDKDAILNSAAQEYNYKLNIAKVAIANGYKTS